MWETRIYTVVWEEGASQAMDVEHYSLSTYLMSRTTLLLLLIFSLDDQDSQA